MTRGPIRAVIVDDEPPARKKLRRLTADDGRAEIVGEAGDGLSAVDLISEARPELVFLDIQMPEMDGFDVVEALDDPAPRIVFVTAYDAFALKAFDVAAVDYLLKPVARERFTVAMDRAEAAIASAGPAATDALGALREQIATRPLTRFLVTRANRRVLVPVGRVRWLEAARNYVRLHTDGEAHLVRAALADLERRLDPDEFVRIHRSTIVNLSAIDRFEPVAHGDWDVILGGGVTLRLSRRYREGLEDRLSV